MRKLMIQGIGFAGVLKDFIILCVMTIAIIGIALKNFKDKI